MRTIAVSSRSRALNALLKRARFNFTRMRTEPKSVHKGEVASIDSVGVVDASTIKINLKRPDAALLATLPIAPDPGWGRREDEVTR
jgi:peptide/nickel transport system substrate-binding protein